MDNPDNTFTPDSITGTNGDLTIDANGHWAFTANSAFNQLNVGDKVEETFTVSSVDGTPSTIKVTINGTNDAATVSSATVAIDETDKAVTTSGTLTSTDVDNPDNTFTPDSITGANGDLTIDASGRWVFTANSSFNQLNVGDKVEETFTVSSVDGTPSTIKVTINGTNDAATVSTATVSVDETDKAVTTSGTLTSTDVDNPDNTFTPDSIAGTNGDLTIDANGHWVFTANSAFNQLNIGDKVEETFTVSSIDGTPSTIKVTINGTNDTATVSSATVAIDETDKAVTTSGTLTSTDVDNPDNTFTPDSITGSNGDLTIDANGHWVFTSNNAFNQLNVGDKVEETFTVSSIDGTTSTIKVMINGTNDAATVSTATASVDETDSAITTSGTLTSTDVDNPDNTFTPDSITGTNGDLTIDANGHWTFTANSAFNQLNVGDKVEETFTVSSVDGTPSTIKVTINGTNDKAVISGTSAGAVTEESQLQTSGSLTVTDVDADEAHFSNTDIAGTLGTLHLNDSGTWTYALDNTNHTVQALSNGATATDTITVHSADGTPHQVTITVNGTNDSAVIGGTNSGAVTEESQLQTSGTLTVTDVDTGEAHFSNTDIVGNLGTLHLTDSGAWTYDLDNTNPSVQTLGVNKTATDTITVHSADGTPHQVTITVNGTNDSAVIGGTNSGAVTEESQLQTSGILTVTDVDTGEAHFSNTDIKGSLGTLHLTDSGAWTYDLDNSNPSVQALAKGQQVKDIITVQSADSTPHQISIVVNGQNDAAVITGTTTGTVTEDRINGMNWLLAGGTMHVSDIDSGEAKFDPVLHAHNYAGIGYTSTLGAEVVVTPDGDWDYQLDNNITQVQSLGQGQSYIDKVTVHTVDGTTQELQITITGTNDAPTVTGSRVLPAGTEDQTLRITQTQLLAGATDIDKNDAGTLHVDAVTADHGTVTQNADGSFTFHPDQDYNGQVHFTYDVQDAHGGVTHTSATTSLSAVGDAAVITGSGSGVKEDINVDISSGHLLGASGVFHVVDPDGPAQSQFPDVLYGGIYQGSHGGDLQVNSNGNYYYHMSNYLVQHLSEGEILKEEYTIHSVDGTQHKVEFTVEGTNDKPVLSAQSQSVTEGGTLLSGQMHATDVDTKDTHTFTIEKPVDGLTFNNDGSYTFDPSHASYQNLGANNDQVIHVQVKVDDHNGGTDTKTLTLVVHGTNDGATIGGQDTFTVQEDHNLTLNSGNTIIYNGQLTITDADAGEDHFDGNLHQNQQTGTWDTGYTTQEGGKLILQSNGSYRYEIDNSLAKIQSLGSNETLIDTVTVRSADGTPHQIQVTILGDNDAPVVSSAVTLAAGTEDTDVVLHVSDLLANATDIDHNDAGQLSVANLTADHGNITDNHDGTFTFHPTQDYNGKVSFTYDVQDTHGGSVATSASITLAPTRDSAVISGNDTGSIIEDHNVGHSSAQKIAISGSLSVTDPDTGEDHFRFNQFGEKAIHDPFGGDLRITPAGSWGYEVSNSRLQSLAEGEVEKVVYRVYSADHTAHDITITVTGTNDQPTIIATTLAHGTEDTHYQMQASQFGFTDIDTGDTLHSIAITDLPSATQGKFVLDGHDVTAGQHISTTDITKLQFVPAQDFNGDVQFKYTVNDGHDDSQEATNTLHIDAVGDTAVITGKTIGDVDEGHGTYQDRSPNYAQPGMGKLTNDPLYTDGKLEIIDPDNGEAQFDTKGVGYSYHGTYGQLILNADGNWHYMVTVGSNQQNVATQIDQLGDGQQLTDTITVYSKDGTAQDIVITIHGDNDRPYISSEVTLNAGTEDTRQTLTTAQLLANTVDVDKNDAGLLSIENLHADHGSILNNADGTFTFTPEKDYNGDVHFSYDVKDAHGGVTHTGASTTLAAVDDKTIISGVDHGVATEDVATHMLTHVNIMDAVDWQALQITDVDSPNTQVTVEFAGKQYTWNIGSGLDVTTPYGKFQFHTIASGSHKGEHSWSYIGDNNNVHVQELKHGESLTESIKLIATDGTEFPITVKVNGTEDGVVIDSNSELGHVVENAQTGASVSGNVVAHDVDLHDTVSWTQTPTAGISGQYGTFHLSADGQWHYDVDQSKATTLGDGTEYWEHFTVEAVSTDGSHVSESVSVVVHGNNDVPTVSGEVTLPSGKEDTSIHITQAELIANATDVDTNDRGWLHAQNLTADHGSLVSNSDGSFTFNPDPNYNGVVHFTYDVADRHGGIAHTGASTTLAAVNDLAIITGTGGHLLEEDNLYYGYTIKTSGQFHVVDPDGPSQSKFPDGLHHHTGSLGGTLQLYGNGNYFYHIDNSAVNHLAKGQEAKETFTIHSVDGTSHQVEFVIEGTNDAPFVHGDVTLSPGTEDTAVTLHVSDLLAQAGDYDDGETARLSVHNLSADHGTVTDNKDGTYTFNPDADYNGPVHFSYDVQDPQGATVATSASMNLAAVDDAAAITGQDTAVAIEDHHAVEINTIKGLTNIQHGIGTSGLLTIIDADVGEEHFISQRSTQAHGNFILTSSGQWHYTVDNSRQDVQTLGVNQSITDHILVSSADGTTHTINITIKGTNDVPTVTSEVIITSGTEDTKMNITTADLLTNAADIDLNDAGQLSVSNLVADHGSVVDNKDGTFTFTPTKDYNGQVHFTYDVQDAHGGVTHTGASTTLSAVNDVAIITGTGGHLLEEDNLYYGYTIKTSGQFHVVDPDGPSQSKFPDGLHHHTGSLGGTLQLYGNGNYFYHIDNSAVNHLAKGQEAKETFTIHSVDGTSHQVEFVIEGTNDAPFVHGDVTLSPGTEDTAVTLHVSDLLAQAGDYDDGETARLSVHNLSADHGTVTDNKDGTYTFNPDADYNGTVHFTYDVQDPQGATVATSASMALAAVADTPVLSVDITDTSDNTVNASESGAAAISGTLDPSVASTLDRIEITDGTTTVTVDKANITVATDGTYQTTADLTSLKDGTLTVTAHATSHDGTTATSTDTILKDTQVSLPTITFESAGADNLYSKAEIARGQANTITATVTPPSDAKIGEHLVVNGQDHVLDAHSLQHGIQIEVHPGSNVQATMTDEHGNTAGSQGFAASAIPEPIVVRPPSGSHQVSGTLGVPPLLPSLTPVPTAQSGWRIHLPNGQYVTSHHGQYGTLTIDPQTGHLHYQEQAQVHTGPHGSASGIGQHEDKFEVALQGTNQDEVVAHVNIQILSHGPGHSGKLTVGTEVVDMTITPLVHTSHPAPPPPPPVQHNEPDMASQADFTVTLSDDSNLDLTLQTHQEPDQKTSHHGAAAYLDALGIKPDSTSTTAHDQPADMDIVLAQVDQPDAVTHDQAHLDMSDALEHHDANINHNQDDEHHHHNDVDGLPDIDPNS